MRLATLIDLRLASLHPKLAGELSKARTSVAVAKRLANRFSRETREPAIRWIVFLTLARGGVRISEKWEGLLPFGTNATRKEFHECLDALSANRRVPAFEKAFANALPAEVIRAGFAFLAHTPAPEIIEMIAKASRKTEVPSPRVVRQRLAHFRRPCAQPLR